uniref:Uncharacterized protein n=1 Tax=Timema poppense TaxID=170557 RepID=A0A7R9GVG6_TIMPO|nr:unnamed protein product [Timema poppensis]
MTPRNNTPSVQMKAAEEEGTQTEDIKISTLSRQSSTSSDSDGSYQTDSDYFSHVDTDDDVIILEVYVAIVKALYGYVKEKLCREFPLKEDIDGKVWRGLLVTGTGLALAAALIALHSNRGFETRIEIPIFAGVPVSGLLRPNCPEEDPHI